MKVEVINETGQVGLTIGTVFEVDKEDDLYYYGMCSCMGGSYYGHALKTDCKEYEGIEIVEFIKKKFADKPKPTIITKTFYDWFECKGYIDKYYLHIMKVDTDALWDYMSNTGEVRNDSYYYLSHCNFSENSKYKATVDVFLEEFGNGEDSIEFYISW